MDAQAREQLRVTTWPAAGTERGTLVLLHGLFDAGAAWADAVARWSDGGWRVVTPDARGHGRSPRWTEPELRGRPGDVMADDAAHLVRQLGGPVALVGHSMGAGVAVAAAVAVHEQVWAVVAEDPPWPLPPAGPDAAKADEWVRGHEADLRTPREVRIERRRRDSPAWPEAEREATAEGTELTDPGLLRTGDIAPSTPWPELVDELCRNEVPLLVLTGDHDMLVDSASEAEAERRGARVVRVPGAGHCVRRDCGDAYYRAVDDFLARHVPKSAG